MQTFRGSRNQFGSVFGKERGKGFSPELSDEKTAGGEDRCHQHGTFYDTNQTVVFLRPVVVPRNGLHALVEADDNHHDEENQAVADAVGTHRHVTTVLRHAARDENRDHASTEVDEKGRQADDERFAHDACVGVENVAAQVDEVVLR